MWWNVVGFFISDTRYVKKDIKKDIGNPMSLKKYNFKLYKSKQI